jgi:hypothetical protein
VAGTAGTVTVDFAAETARFTAEVKKVRAEFSAMRQSVEGAQKTLVGFGNGLRNLVGLVSIGAGLRYIAQQTRESQDAIAQLNRSLAGLAPNAAAASEDMQAFATTLQRQTVFSDEAALGVITLLNQFRGLTSGIIKRATADVLDLSTAMGIDTATAAKTLGKALEDPVKGMTALGRLGVKFSADQQEAIKALVQTGDRAGALNIVLGEIENRFGGAARAARDTFGGALTSLQNTFGDLFEAKDSSLANATASINELTKTLQSPEIKEGIDAFITGIAGIAAAAFKALGGLAKLGVTAADIWDKYVTGSNSRASAAESLADELAREQVELAKMQRESYAFSQAEIASQEAYIETLKQRIEIAKQLPKPDDGTGVSPRKALELALAPIVDPNYKTPDAFTEDAFKQEELAKTQLEAYQEIQNMKLVLDQEFQDKIRENFERRISEENSLMISSIEYRRDLESQYLLYQKTLRQQNTADAIQLLGQLGAKNKAFAVAAVVIEKALAVRRILQANAVAAELAFASQLIPGVPASLAAAAAAKAAVLAQGRISAALTIAEGALQIGNIAGGGGTGKGSQFDPIHVQTEDRTDVTPGASSQRVVQVVFNGNVYGQEDFQRAVIDAVRDATDERDVIVISPTSRNALELRAQ